MAKPFGQFFGAAIILLLSTISFDEIFLSPFKRKINLVQSTEKTSKINSKQLIAKQM